MKKILFIAVLAITAISCDKKDDNNTNSIVGRWMVSQVVFTETEIGTETDLIDDTTYNINDTETYTVPGDSLDGFGVEFLTDGSVITFDNSESEDKIESDIFVSIDRVKENAQTFEVSFERELHRVMIHGVLHLLGFKDKTDAQSEEMRRQEDTWLEKLEL